MGASSGGMNGGSKGSMQAPAPQQQGMGGKGSTSMSAPGAQNYSLNGQNVSSDPGSKGSGGMGGKGSTQPAAPWSNQANAQNSLNGGQAGSFGQGMWGQNAGQGLMFGLGGQPQFGWEAPNLQGGPLPGQTGSGGAMTLPPGWATGLPGQAPNMPGAPSGVPPPGWTSGSLTPGTPGGSVTSTPVGTTAPVSPGSTPQPNSASPSNSAPAPVNAVPPAPVGTPTLNKPLLTDNKAAVAGAAPLTFGGAGSQPFATANSTATQSQTPAGQQFLANLSKYGSAAAANYLNTPQSFTVNDFNKAAGANPALSTQMLASGGQAYKDAVMQANGWSPEQMNQFINTNGSGALSGYTPQAIAQLKALGIG